MFYPGTSIYSKKSTALTARHRVHHAHGCISHGAISGFKLDPDLTMRLTKEILVCLNLQFETIRLKFEPMKNDNLQLIRPSIKFKKSFLDALREFQDEKLSWVMHLNIDEIRENFEAFVEAELNKKTLWTKDTPVDETELWAILDDNYVGRISIRHHLNNDLKVMGGHIGYDTRPSYRGRGLASAMLKQALPIARHLGISKALLTCNDSNLASIRVIEKNHGVLQETKPQFEGGPLKRYYWISTENV